MKKKALISVTSKQKGGVEDALEIVTPGVFYKEVGKLIASYEETEISGMEGTTTTLEINKDTFILNRVGTTSSRMNFFKGNKDVILYNTPHGALELNFIVHDVQVNVTEDGGIITADYDLIIGNQEPINTVIEVKINTDIE